jgi:hypothetical protein
VPDPVSVFIQCIIQVEDRSSGISEDGIDAVLQQNFGDQL